MEKMKFPKQIPEEMFDTLIKQTAEHLSDLRKLKQIRGEFQYLINHLREIQSTREEMVMDWHDACVFLISNILSGKDINFTSIEPRSYHRLEEIWLKEVKQLRAYFIWEMNDTGSDEKNYLEACNEIRRRLTDRSIKASLKDFMVVEDYLRYMYLDDMGKIDKNKPSARILIQEKAKRIWETTGNSNGKENWSRAKLYVTMFYENIIPAVLENNKDNILMVLKAFQFSKAKENRFLIINCFEAAIAIYFLDADIILTLWERPELSNFSMVPVIEWPKDFKYPLVCRERFKYDDEDELIIYEGKMSKNERNALIKKLTRCDHKKAVLNLFRQSNSDARSMTL